MRSYEKIMAESADRTPFSNSTLGEMWMEGWCYAGCLWEEDCPLLLLAFQGRTPSEWRVLPKSPQEHGVPQDYHCIEYTRDLP